MASTAGQRATDSLAEAIPADAEPRSPKQAAPASPPAPPPPPQVQIGSPAYLTEGEVPLLPRMLAKARDPFARCVSQHGGLRGRDGAVSLQFLVRYRGRAEGVGILASRGLSSPAKRCVRGVLQNRWVGAPSVDPVGVTVELRFRAQGRPRAEPTPAAAPSAGGKQAASRAPRLDSGGGDAEVATAAAAERVVPLRRSAKHRFRPQKLASAVAEDGADED